MTTDERRNDLIKKACLVFSKYDVNGPRNNIEYLNALRPIRESAKESGISLDELYSEYLKRKEIIDEANSIFTIMNSNGSKNNNELMIRLGKIREKAKELGINLSSLWRRQKGFEDMFDDEIDIHTIKLEDSITEEYCEAFLKNTLKLTESEKNVNVIDSRILMLDDSKMRGPDEFSYSNDQMTFNILFEGMKILISKIKRGDTDGIVESTVSSVLEIGIENFEEFFHKRKTENEALKKFINNRFKDYYVGYEHVGSYGAGYFYKQKDNDKNPITSSSSNAYRIYLNIPRTKQSEEFIMDYCVECQRQEISFDMKLFYNPHQNHTDATILYSTYADINKKVAILKKMLDKYPDIQFGSPPASCAKIDGIEELGICHVGVVKNIPIDDVYLYLDNIGTYNDYIDGLFCLALRRVIEDLGYSSFFGEALGCCTSQNLLTGLSIKSPFKKNKDKLNELIKKILSDKNLKERVIRKLCDYMHQEHNKINGYSIYDKKSIALDTWYLDELKVRHSKDSVMFDSDVKR